MEDEKEKLQGFDNLNDLPLIDEEPMNIDPDADAFAGFVLPPDGVHMAKLSLGKGGAVPTFQPGVDKNGKKYIAVNVEARIVAEDKPYNNAVIFDQASTIVMQSTGTCRIAGILQALRVPVPSTMTKNQIVAQLAAQLEGEPLVQIETQWQAREQQDDGKWKTVVRGQKRFTPKHDADGNVVPGEYETFAESPRTGAQVDAKAIIVRYLPA